MVSIGDVSASGEKKLPDPFKIVSIRAVSAPAGAAGADWYRYEICQGDNTIVGFRKGTAGIVREAVELIVVRLNMRRMLKSGRVHIILQGKSRQRLQ